MFKNMLVCLEEAVVFKGFEGSVSSLSGQSQVILPDHSPLPTDHRNCQLLEPKRQKKVERFIQQDDGSI